jgi:hypothetical protein
MLRPDIKQLVENKFGKEINYPKDCAVLAEVMRIDNNLPISSSTLKRVFGFYGEIEKPRLHTLDMLAKYLGYKNWAELDNHLLHNDSGFDEIETIEIDKLELNNKLVIEYSSIRKIRMQYLGEFRFELLESTSSKLRKGDILRIHNLVKGYPLICQSVIRDNTDLGKYIGGRTSGITYLCVLDTKKL